MLMASHLAIVINMTTIILALWLGIAVAGFTDYKYDDKTCYVYKYQTQLVSGVQPTGQQWGGLLLTSELELCFAQRDIGHAHQTFNSPEPYFLVTAQMKNANLQRIDQYISDKTPKLFMQTEDKLLDGVEADVIPTMMEQLKKPFQFRWFSGLGSQDSIQIDTEEPLWSVNIKKAIVVLLQVNLDQLFSVDTVLDKSASVDPNMQSYSVWEATSSGYCLTRYTPKMSELGRDSFYLTKVRDYSTCLTPSPMSFVFSNVPGTDTNTTKHLDIQSQSTYSIMGDKKQFIVYSVFGENIFTFVPYGNSDRLVQTIVNQSLVLQTSYRMSVVPDLTLREEKLTMVVPSEIFDDKAPYTFYPKPTSQYTVPTWSVVKMDQILSWVAEGTNQYPSQEVLIALQTLMEMVHHSSYDSLKQLLGIQEISSLDQSETISDTKLNTYWNILGTSGSSSASKLLIDVCLTKLTQSTSWQDRCLDAVTKVGMYAPPSEALIFKMIDLLSKRSLPSEVRIACTLATGSIMGRAEELTSAIMKHEVRIIHDIEMVMSKGMQGYKKQILTECKIRSREIISKLKTRHNEISEEFLKMTVDHWLKDGDDMQVVVGLEALRNAHVAISVISINHILTSMPPKSVTVKMAAVRAFEKFHSADSQVRSKVLKILLWTMKNPEDDCAVKIQAFRTLLSLQAPVTLLIDIATSVRHSDEKQLSTYVWTTLDALRNSSFRPYQEMADKARSAILYMQPVQHDLGDSFHFHAQSSLATNVDVLGELNHVGVPRSDVTHLDSALYYDVFGTANKAFQVSVTSQGIVTLMKKLVGPKGFFTKQNMIFDLFTRGKRSVSGFDVRGAINQIAHELNIQDRELGVPKSVISLQLKNNVVRLWDISSLLQSVSQLESIKLNVNQNELMKKGLQFDTKSTGILDQYFMELPTEAGIPLSLQLGVTYSANVKGAAKIAALPNMYKEERGDKQLTRAVVALDLESRVVTSIVGKMSVDGYLYKAGSWFQAEADIHIPVMKARLSYDIEKNHVKFEMQPPISKDIPIAKLHVSPFVYSSAIMNYSASSANQKVAQRPMIFSMQPMSFSESSQVKTLQYRTDSMGYDVALQGEYHWSSICKQGPFSPLCGESRVAFYVHKSEQTPNVLRADLRLFTPAQQAKKTYNSIWWWLSSEEEAGDDVMLDFGFSSPVKSTKGNHPRYPVVENLDFQSIISRFEELAGKSVNASKTPYAVVVTMTASSELVSRQYWAEAMIEVSSDVEGHVTNGILNVEKIVSPVPTADTNSTWQMLVKFSTQYPFQYYSVMDLLQPDYQMAVEEFIEQLIHKKQHAVINRYIPLMLETKIKRQLQIIPSSDPHIILDSIVPELLYKYNDGHVLGLLSKLIPLNDIIKEIKDELKDVLKISASEKQIIEISKSLIMMQRKTKQILDRYSMKSSSPQLHYIAMKISESVHDILPVLKRAVRLQLIADPFKFERIIKVIESKQQALFNSLKQFYIGQSQPIKANERIIHLGEKQTSLLVSGWMRFSKKQFQNVPEFDQLISLASQTIQISAEELISNVDMADKKQIWNVILLASIQHQMLVDFAHAFRFCDDSCANAPSVSSKQMYFLKVQTRQLLEQAVILQHEEKLQQTCVKSLGGKPDEIETLRQLVTLDKQLIMLQKPDFPQMKSPSTAVPSFLDVGYQILKPAIETLEVIRDKLASLSVKPEPCLMQKYLETLFVLQGKLHVYKANLPAQDFNFRLAEKYESMDEATYNLIASLQPIFVKYFTEANENSPDIFSPAYIHISQAEKELQWLELKQKNLDKNIVLYLEDNSGIMADTVEEQVKEDIKQCEDVLKLINNMVPRIRVAAMSTTHTNGQTIVNKLSDILDNQKDICDKMSSIIEIYDVSDSEIKASKIRRIKEIAIQLLNNIAEVPSQIKSSVNMADTDVTDYDDENSALYGKYGHYGSTKFGHYRLKRAIPVAPELSLVLQPKIQTSVQIDLSGLNQINILLFATKSVEQLLWESLQFFPLTRDQCVSQAIQQKITGRYEMEECGRQVAQKLNSFYHVHSRIEAVDMPEMLQQTIESLLTKLETVYYDKTQQYSQLDFIDDKNMFEVILDFHSDLHSVDGYVMTSDKTLAVKSVPVYPMALSAYPLQLFSKAQRSVTKALANIAYPGTCIIQDDTLKTNDGYIYTLLPMSSTVSKPLLLAMDCSKDRTFAILLDKDQQTTEILAEEHSVIVSSHPLSVTLTVDGQTANLMEGSLQVYKQVSYGKEAVVLHAWKEGQAIHVEYPLVGLDFYFSRNSTVIDMSAVYKNQLCGLCGNYDLQKSLDLETPSGMVIQNEVFEFMKSYQLSSWNPLTTSSADQHDDTDFVPYSLRSRQSGGEVDQEGHGVLGSFRLHQQSQHMSKNVRPNLDTNDESLEDLW